MKQFVRSLFLLAIAAAVFFTGAGVTVVSYCCNKCSEQTLFAMEHRCGSDKHHEDTNSCCSTHAGDACQKHNNSEGSKHCSASRLSIDLDSSMSRPHVATPFVWLTDASLSTIQLLPSSTIDTGYEEHIEMPPTLLPRSYLSLIRVLII